MRATDSRTIIMDNVFVPNGLERLLRDVRASHYHPLPAKQQMVFSGRLALGLDPIA